ncbi:hypothetical protein [Hyphomicrobium sp.]|uniref:hypothetical protein n=1 Tax=Hyphomicrobium sp. TaxID=82 RepID=UPI0026CFD751
MPLVIVSRKLAELEATSASHVMPKADPPADVVLRAVTSTRPRRRYTAGKIARQISLLCRLSPAEIFDKGLRKQLRLPV